MPVVATKARHLPDPSEIRRALLVEDDPQVAFAVEEALRSRGVQVTTVGTAEAALKAALEHAFDVVVTDYGLPGATGAWLLGELRKQRPELRRILLSGTPEVAADELERDGTCHKFLRKPCPAPELMAAMWETD